MRFPRQGDSIGTHCSNTTILACGRSEDYLYEAPDVILQLAWVCGDGVRDLVDGSGSSRVKATASVDAKTATVSQPSAAIVSAPGANRACYGFVEDARLDNSLLVPLELFYEIYSKRRDRE